MLEFGHAIATTGEQVKILQSRLAGITGDARAFETAQASANKLGVATADVAAMFGRFAMASKEIGLTTRETPVR